MAASRKFRALSPVELLEIRAGAHGMDQIVGDVHALEPLADGFRVEDIPFEELDPVVRRRLGLPGIPDEQPETDGVGGEQSFLEPSSDVARGAGQQDPPGFRGAGRVAIYVRRHGSHSRLIPDACKQVAEFSHIFLAGWRGGVYSKKP